MASDDPVLAVDVDDTICETALTLIQQMVDRFEAPKGWTAEEIWRRYEQPGAVDFWQDEAAQSWLRETYNQKEVMLSLPPVAGARDSLKRITALVPLGCYITSRVHGLRETTEKWLQRHDFPPAEVITRGVSTMELNWKAMKLYGRGVQLWGMIDDTVAAFRDWPPELEGRRIWMNRVRAKRGSGTRVIEVHNWGELVKWVELRQIQ